jgi:catechol 2,3-dioxygenase-like lactoylglutathione lyase family enzyme
LRRSIFVLSLVSTLAAGTAWAQPYTPNEVGVTMGHWHLNSRDIEANKKVFVALGGTATKPGDFTIVQFPGVNVYLNQRAGTPPPTAGTEGSVVNHVGFLVPNVQDALAKLNGLGLHVTSVDNRKDQAFVFTGDGLKIELLEDKDQKIPIRHHHVHFYVAESAVPEIQAWYGKVFGAKPGMRGRFQAADVPGANLTFTKSDQPTVTTKGRILDHIGFDVTNMEEFLKRAEAAGVKPVVAPSKNASNGVWLAFIADPWGTYIELNQRPNQTYLNQM